MKKHNDLETGRSMVEMLGVLAIVGVITIGGIVGYRYAMDYIMTNAIITGIRARAVIVIQQRVLGYELNLQEFHPNTPEDLIYGRFRVEAVNDYQLRGEEHQALEVFNIPHRVCKNIYNTTFGEEITLIVNGAEENPNGLDPCLPDGVTEDSADVYHNVVAFVFGNGAPCEDDNDCPNAACWECSPLGMCIPKAKDTPCGAGGCCDSNGGCTLCVIACDPDEVASACRTSCDTSTGNWNLKAAGSKCGANNCGVCNSDGQCVGDNTKTITKCDGTPEVCCAADADCKDESPCAIPCTGTAPACQTCDTTRGEFVADATQNGTAVGACGMCQDGAIVQRTGVSVGDCKKCDLATGDIVNDNSADGSTCGTSCGQCNNGSCESKVTTITKCDGSTESCCPLTETCENAQNCECPSGYQTNSCTTTTLDTKTLGDGTTCYKCEAPSCPNGGDFGTDGTTCCKDNHAWNEDDAYTIINIPVCGCPENEGLSLGNDGITCCGDGLAFTGDGTENSVNISACGCPLGGTLIDETTCCHNGYVWRDGTQGEGGVVPHEANVALCGCPSGATFGTDNTTCCKNGRAYNADLSISSSNVVPSICGCPDGGEFGYDNETCCRRGYAWDMTTQSYLNLNTVCGCPHGGYLGKDNATCCLDGLAWIEKESYYSGTNIEVCGCPRNGSLNSSGECCYNRRIWNGISYGKTDRSCYTCSSETCGACYSCEDGWCKRRLGCCVNDTECISPCQTCTANACETKLGYKVVEGVCESTCPKGTSPTGSGDETDTEGCFCENGYYWVDSECVADPGCTAKISDEANHFTLRECCTVVGNTITCKPDSSKGCYDYIYIYDDLDAPACKLVGDGIGFQLSDNRTLRTASITVNSSPQKSVYASQGSLVDARKGIEVSGSQDDGIFAYGNIITNGVVAVSNTKAKGIYIGTDGAFDTRGHDVVVDTTGDYGIQLHGSMDVGNITIRQAGEDGIYCVGTIDALDITSSADHWAIYISNGSRIKANTVYGKSNLSDAVRVAGELECSSLTGETNNQYACSTGVSGQLTVLGNLSGGISNSGITNVSGTISSSSSVSGGGCYLSNSVNGTMTADYIESSCSGCVYAIENKGTMTVREISAIGNDNDFNNAGIYNNGTITANKITTTGAKGLFNYYGTIYVDILSATGTKNTGIDNDNSAIHKHSVVGGQVKGVTKGKDRYGIWNHGRNATPSSIEAGSVSATGTRAYNGVLCNYYNTGNSTIQNSLWGRICNRNDTTNRCCTTW